MDESPEMELLHLFIIVLSRDWTREWLGALAPQSLHRTYNVSHSSKRSVCLFCRWAICGPRSRPLLGQPCAPSQLLLHRPSGAATLLGFPLLGVHFYISSFIFQFPKWASEGFFFFKKNYLFLAALGLCCCVPAFSGCGEQTLLFVAVHGLLLLRSTGSRRARRLQ